MKSFAAIALSVISAVAAVPVGMNSTLPDGFTPITRTEIQSILASNATESNRVYICTGEEFYGTCGTKVVNYDECTTLDQPFYHDVGSFSPGNGDYCRITISSDSCTEEGDLFIEPPGISSLNNYEGINYASNITSFMCSNCEDCQW